MIQKKITPFLFLLPYIMLFSVFIIIPVMMAIGLSFTNFDTIQAPDFVGLQNYINLLTQDLTFLQNVLPNSILLALFVGPGGYMLAFFLAWSLAQITKLPRTVLALLIYSPSMATGVATTAVWRSIFLGNQNGYLNAILIQLGIINEPIIFLLDPRFIMPFIILVTMWGSMGVGFLAMLAGVLNVDKTLYEAASLDGVKNRFQEIFYITIPSMKPQMLFGAVMSIVSAFQSGALGVALTGSNPTPNYVGQVMVNHIEDYGFIRYEMGYAAAISVVLLILIYIFSFVSRKLFQDD